MNDLTSQVKKSLTEYQSRKPVRENLEPDEIIDILKERGILGEFIGEGNDRIVYGHAKNDNLVIKIPKSYHAKSQNEWEASHYLEEESMRCKMQKEYRPNGLARCALDPELGILYMQKLTVTKGSDFGVTPDGIIRRFDLNVLNM